MRIGSSSMYSGWRYARIETALCSLLIPKRHISTTDTKTMSLLPCLLFPLYSSPPSFCHIFCIPSSNIFPSSSRLLLCPHAGSCARDCDTQNVNLNWHRAVWHALTQLSKMKKKKITTLSWPFSFLTPSLLRPPFQFLLPVIWPATAFRAQTMIFPLALPSLVPHPLLQWWLCCLCFSLFPCMLIIHRGTYLPATSPPSSCLPATFHCSVIHLHPSIQVMCAWGNF